MWNFHVIVLISSTILFASLTLATTSSCKFEPIGDGVCVCDENYCDTLDTEEPSCGSYTLVTSNRRGKRFEMTTGPIHNFNFSFTSAPSSEPLLKINQSIVYQKMIGFGGAFTDATSYQINLMVEPLRECVYKSYMSPIYGAAYKMLRVPIGASDFSDGAFTYNETPLNDVDLTNMTELLPSDRMHIQQINEMKRYQPNSDIKIMLCAWSPPVWMKNIKVWSGLSFLSRKYFKTWALYQANVIRLWQHENLTIWSISTGNEPRTSAIVPFLSLTWLPSEQAVWVSDYLKPTLKEHGLSDVLILGVDDQRACIHPYINAFKRQAKGNDIDIDLIGVHWYFDQFASPELLDRTLKIYKKPILYTEACEGAGLNSQDMIRGPVFGSWKRCQTYVQRIINLLQHSTAGFIDWNMVLDEHGGPNYVGNYVDAPMIFFKRNQTLYKQPMFYGIAHFSTFLQTNCVRIDSKWISRNIKTLDAIAFACDNDRIVAILHNTGPNTERVTVIDERNGQMNLTLDPESVNTLVYKNC